MSEENTPQEEENTSEAEAQESSSPAQPPKQIYLVSYPKVVFLYPTFLAAVVAGFYMLAAGHTAPEADGVRIDQIVALAFLGILGINTVVLSFDFPRATSLTLFFCFATLGLGLVILFNLKPELAPMLTGALSWLRPWANSQFYFLFAAVLGVIFVFVSISVQFDYWEVRPNELLHHHGILSDLERFSAPNLRVDKEINDVFEYLLLKSGRLILHPSNERRAIVLENVFFINRKERALTRMLGAVQVSVRSDGH